MPRNNIDLLGVRPLGKIHGRIISEHDSPYKVDSVGHYVNLRDQLCFDQLSCGRQPWLIKAGESVASHSINVAIVGG